MLEFAYMHINYTINLLRTYVTGKRNSVDFLSNRVLFFFFLTDVMHSCYKCCLMIFNTKHNYHIVCLILNQIVFVC